MIKKHNDDFKRNQLEIRKYERVIEEYKRASEEVPDLVANSAEIQSLKN
jgi:hypothetical protein